MLHHHPASADMRDHYTGTPRQPDFVRRRLHRTHRQLLLAPRPPPSPPIAPRRAVSSSSTIQPLPTCGTTAPAPPAGQPSCAVDCTAPTGSSSSHRARLHHRQSRLVAPCRPPPPPATPHRARPASSTTGCASLRQAGVPLPAAPPRAKPASAAASRACTCRAGLRALLRSLLRRPNAVVCHASPASRPRRRPFPIIDTASAPTPGHLPLHRLTPSPPPHPPPSPATAAAVSHVRHAGNLLQLQPPATGLSQGRHVLRPNPAWGHQIQARDCQIRDHRHRILGLRHHRRSVVTIFVGIVVLASIAVPGTIAIPAARTTQSTRDLPLSDMQPRRRRHSCHRRGSSKPPPSPSSPSFSSPVATLPNPAEPRGSSGHRRAIAVPATAAVAMPASIPAVSRHPLGGSPGHSCTKLARNPAAAVLAAVWLCRRLLGRRRGSGGRRWRGAAG
uniref:Uncharacterized protein n=1 Tax=Oryza nivara TaxID=4536 RepID=A0A0E0IG24_ORYNI